jgi:mono/diheme cytochrome c family protein
MKKILKWVGIILGTLVVLLAIVFGVLLGIGTARANQDHEIAVVVPPIPTDTEAIQRGQHLAVAILTCTSCHGEKLEGKLEFAIPGLLTVPTPNLTAGVGGIGIFYTDEDWVLAIQHGVGYDGRALFIMPSQAFSHLSQEDMGVLIAYLKSVPPVDSAWPERRIEPMARVMMAVGAFPPFAVDNIDHALPPQAAPEPGMDVAYGKYLTRTCTECHGAELNGKPFGPPGEEVPSPNLTPGGPLAAWREEDFIKTMRTGVPPGGRTLSEDMPWKSFGQMTDEELQAVWLYLQSLPPLAQSSGS